jgi:hypothetical protein
MPYIFNLRRDPFERAEVNSNTYLDWMVDHVPQMYLAQEVVAEQIAGFIKFPPRQKPAAFNLDAVLAQFNRLIQELLRGNMHRNTFRPWEIELLLDIESCTLREASKRDMLRRYQKAVQRQMEKGARLPLKLSEYLEAVKTKRGDRVAS